MTGHSAVEEIIVMSSRSGLGLKDARGKIVALVLVIAFCPWLHVWWVDRVTITVH